MAEKLARPKGARRAEAEAQIGPRRAERLARQERQRRLLEQAVARQRRRRFLIGGGVLAVVVLGAAALVLPALLGGGRSDVAGVQSFSIPNRAHVQARVAYPQTPPAGGNHAPVWQNCGFYSAPIVKENGVHTLEHGAVWITYRPALPAEQVEVLRQLARGQTFVLVSPFPDLPAPVVASAWARQLRLDSADDPRLREFVRAFRVGPTTPEPGAPCTGGLGQPG